MTSAAEIRTQAAAAVANIGTKLPAAPAPAPDKDAIIANLQSQLAAAMSVVAGNAGAITQQPAGERKAYRSIYQVMRVPIMRAPGHCEFVEFVGGRLETSDPTVIAVVDRMIAAGGSGVYTDELGEPLADVQAMQEDVRLAAEAAQTKMVKAGLPTA